jgi:hypothetical protein
MKLPDQVGFRQIEYFMVAGQVFRMILESIPTIIGFGQPPGLKPSARGTIQEKDTL